MYKVDMGIANEDFQECWTVAGNFINNCGKNYKKAELEGFFSWLRAHLSPPLIEHLSFRFGNKIYFIQIYDIDYNLKTPNDNVEGLVRFSKRCSAIPCLLPMKRDQKKIWSPVGKGWCLISAIDGSQIDPIKLLTNEKIEMSDWEVHDTCVTLIKDKLYNQGNEILSWQSNPDVFPSLWYCDEEGPKYVIVGSGRYPKTEILKPKNLEDIKEEASKMSPNGFYCYVILRNLRNNKPNNLLFYLNQIFGIKLKEKIFPLIRGEQMNLRMSEMLPLYKTYH